MGVCKVNGLHHEKGSVSIVSGVKSGGRMPTGRIVGGGHGTYVLAEEAHLLMSVEKDGCEIQIQIEKEVREKLGRKRITQSLVEKLIESLPDTVEVQELRKMNNEPYCKLTEASLKNWLKKIK